MTDGSLRLLADRQEISTRRHRPLQRNHLAASLDQERPGGLSAATALFAESQFARFATTGERYPGDPQRREV